MGLLKNGSRGGSRASDILASGRIIVAPGQTAPDNLQTAFRMSLLVLAAHPDDETLGAGGTMARAVESGEAVHAIVVCDTARYDMVDDGGFTAAKASELSRAMDSLGVTFECLGLPDQRLDIVPLVEIAGPIELTIARFRPSTVLTHFSGDVNQDHRRVFEATLIACRAVPASPVRRLASYYVPSSSDCGDPARGFVPNAYQELEDRHVDAKLLAMSLFASEMRPPPHPRSDAGIRSALSHFGSRICARYAEPFVIIREQF